MLPIERIDAEAFARWGEMKGASLAMCRGFARAIEAEARVQDTALIRQLVEALTAQCSGEERLVLKHAAIKAAHARLKEIAP